MVDFVAKAKGALERLMPKFRLPLNGFVNPDYHVLAWYPGALDLYMRLSLLDKAYIAKTLYMNARTELDVIRKGLMVNKYGRHLLSLQFYGVQPMRFKGLTQYKNKNIDSYGSSLHYVLTNDEYIIWNKPVRACANGKVIKVICSNPDNVNNYRNDYFNPTAVSLYSFEKFIGNHISIQHENGFITTYGSLKQNSATVRVGDTVNVNQIIGRVGCSGQNKEPYLNLSLTLMNELSPIPDIISTAIELPAIPFEPFYFYKLFKNGIRDLSSIENIYPKDILYKYSNGSFISDLTLVKPSLTTSVE